MLDFLHSLPVWKCVLVWILVSALFGLLTRRMMEGYLEDRIQEDDWEEAHKAKIWRRVFGNG